MTGPWVIRLGEEEVFYRGPGDRTGGARSDATEFRVDWLACLIAQFLGPPWRVVPVTEVLDMVLELVQHATAQPQTRYEAGCMAGMVEGRRG